MSKLDSNLRLNRKKSQTVGLLFSLMISFLLPQWVENVWAKFESNGNEKSQESLKSLGLSKCSVNRDAQPVNKIKSDSLIVPPSQATTLVAAKETFSCRSSPEQILQLDSSTYIKLTDDIQTQAALDREIEIITCLKDINLNDPIVKCISERPAKLSVPPIKVCASKKPYPPSPMLLDTVIGYDNNSRLVKSIQTDHDTVACRTANGTDIIKNIYTFTHSFEDYDSGVTTKSIDVIVCMEELVNLKVLGCNVRKVI